MNKKTDRANDGLARLTDVLRTCAPAAVAVSGGVDSMTLAFVAARTLGDEVKMFHAVSPAVPPSATDRVKRYARVERWQLAVLDAGEFGDERYLANPSNRCFYCKSNLYGSIAATTSDQILSGTNLDDLGDWRPGLKAAENHSARHPFVEAGVDKESVRAIARMFELDDIADLPGAPCLSSRVETGIPILAGDLNFINLAEQLVQAALTPRTVRCRVRHDGIVIELDQEAHKRHQKASVVDLREKLESLSQRHNVVGAIKFAPYERGSAFLREKS